KFWEVVKTIVKYNEEKKITAYNTVYQTMIVKYLERIADHLVNINEWIVYIKNGYYKSKVIV
ncbi:MAG: phosphate transport system regulatory protein PhoU, partial [Firmicutes bacterium]|nr:phosphate transport system regulatory protein PhoU [Candidatus Onthovivens merdipullorum]